MLNDVLNNVSKLSSETEKDLRSKLMSELFVGILLLLVWCMGLMLFGAYLWNNVARRLVPSLGVARWYDTFLLSILLILLRI